MLWVSSGSWVWISVVGFRLSVGQRWMFGDFGLD